jgi:phosphoglycolate phosphatase-like HAD superfamily hydrolase
MAFKHFIWDFDGTLYDTYHSIVASTALALAEMDIPRPPEEDLTRMAKSTLRGAFVEIAGQDRVEELLARYFVHAGEKGIQDFVPYPGCREALQMVVDAGGDNYLYTHRNHQAVDALERDALIPLFKDFITWEAGFPDKPAPDALLWLCQQHNLNPVDCVMVGDRSIDLNAAKNAGIASALFDPDGYLPATSAEQVFSSLTDLAQALLKEEKE